MIQLTETLSLKPGVTAVIGGGGKTTLLRTLGEALARDGCRVLLCATTKLYPFPGLRNLAGAGESEIADAMQRERLVCAGAIVKGTGKLTAPAVSMKRLAALADYVLVEADGSAGRPLKAHAAHEPVIPEEANQVLFVVGASGFGQPVSFAAHRPERYAQLAGTEPSALASPELEARVRLAEGLPDRVFVNQAETPEDFRNAELLAKGLACPVLAGSLLRKEFVQCSC